MTPEEREVLLETPAVQELLAGEREVCAKIAEDKAEECRHYPATPFSRCGDARCDEVAEAIRARGKQ